MNIILGLTGSVASTLYLKLIEDLSKLGNVDVILTEHARKFIDPELIRNSKAKHIYTDDSEWVFKDEFGTARRWEKSDPILHIELRKYASVLVIAPCSANTLAKLSHGICDNLLTSIARAWDLNRPVIIAPAMNTHMWDHPHTRTHIESLLQLGYSVLPPQSKELACGDVGVGAMVDIRDITREVDICTHWSFPLSINACTGIPVTPHPGAFKAVRRDNHIHTGVDLYADEGSEIRACERGRVVSIEPFTGPKDNSPWWKDTDAILIEGASGVICYGELKPAENLKVGSVVGRHQLIGTVKRVILEGKERPEITGWKPSMLHMELYPHGTTKASDGYINIREFLQDPTPYLLKSDYRAWAARPLKPLTWEKPNE